MKRKKYTLVEIDLLYFETEDVITASAGEYDPDKDNDLTSDDIFD